MKISAIKISQPLGDFYITKIKARDLLRISTSSVLRYDKQGLLVGNQRPLKQERLKAIANYIKSEEMCFPTSIIIAANINDLGLIEDGENRWSINHIQNDVYDLVIPDCNKKTSLIIDGQHRLNSFIFTPEKYQDIELVCSIFFDLPSPYQAYLFATINGNQKRVDKSLALEMFGFNVDNEPANTWSPEKLAVFLTRKFNFSVNSPLYQRIKLAPLYSDIEDVVDKTKWLLSTAAMVEGITSLISSNPQRDRDILAMNHGTFWNVKSRKILTNYKDKSVLRDLYLQCNDNDIYDILNSYFKTVKDTLWNNAAQQSVIVKTIGISVLFDLLKEILQQNINIRDFDTYISKISTVDYSHDYFQLSGVGKTRLRRILRYKLGYIEDHDLEPDDLVFVK
jgi:DNA phosphorothioation-associated DGQHR protein 1